MSVAKKIDEEANREKIRSLLFPGIPVPQDLVASRLSQDMTERTLRNHLKVMEAEGEVYIFSRWKKGSGYVKLIVRWGNELENKLENTAPFHALMKDVHYEHSPAGELRLQEREIKLWELEMLMGALATDASETRHFVVDAFIDGRLRPLFYKLADALVSNNQAATQLLLRDINILYDLDLQEIGVPHLLVERKGERMVVFPTELQVEDKQILYYGGA